jgi:hypothetical protein
MQNRQWCDIYLMLSLSLSLSLSLCVCVGGGGDFFELNVQHYKGLVTLTVSLNQIQALPF